MSEVNLGRNIIVLDSDGQRSGPEKDVTDETVVRSTGRASSQQKANLQFLPISPLIQRGFSPARSDLVRSQVDGALSDVQAVDVFHNNGPKPGPFISITYSAILGSNSNPVKTYVPVDPSPVSVGGRSGCMLTDQHDEERTGLSSTTRIIWEAGDRLISLTGGRLTSEEVLEIADELASSG